MQYFYTKPESNLKIIIVTTASHIKSKTCAITELDACESTNYLCPYLYQDKVSITAAD